MNQLQMLKRALIAYVNSVKAVWSAMAHPLSIVSKLKRNVKDYKIYGNSVLGNNLFDEETATQGASINASGEVVSTTIEGNRTSDYIAVNPNSTCTVKTVNPSTSASGVRLSWYDQDKEFISLSSLGGATGTRERNIIVPQNASYVRISTASKTIEFYPHQLTGDEVAEGEHAGKYHLPVEVRGKNYFDLNKVPFSNSTTQPYNNGLKAMKTSANNRGDKIPISLPLNKTIYMTMDVVDSQIAGTATRVTMGFYNSKNTLVRSTSVSSTVAHKSYSFTLSEDISYIQFYFQSNNSHNAVGDYMTIDNIMLRCEGDDVWEPYIKPQSVDIYLDEPVGTDDVIQKSVDGLPSLPQFKGTTVYEVQTEVPPSGMKVEYYE